MNHAFKILQLKAKQQVYTLLSGHSLSKLYGEGYDFAELREYQIGDDIRKINWTITAKQGKPYIKEFHANRELSVVVATLMDGSLYFAQENEKQTKMIQTAMLIAYATQYHGDLFTGIGYSSHPTISTSPTKQLFSIEHFLKTLYTLPLLGTSLKQESSINQLFKHLQKASLLFILGDFLEEVDLSLLAQKHEVIAVIIRHREEQSPQKLKEVILENPKDNRHIHTYFSQKSIHRYLKKQEAHDKKLQEHFARYQIRSIKIFTDEEPIEKLLTLF